MPSGVTIEKIKHGFSKLRNHLIANVLHKCGYIETWGRGIQNIIELCEEASVPDPKFLADELEFKVVFEFPYSLKPDMFVGEAPARYESRTLTSRQKKIFTIIEQHGELNFGEIKKFLKNSISERTLYRELTILKNMKVLASKGRTRNSVWFVLSA